MSGHIYPTQYQIDARTQTCIHPRRCNFTGNTAFGNKGGAIQLLTPKAPSIDTCLFVNNQAAAGAAVYVEKVPTVLNIEHTDFLNNTVMQQIDDADRFQLAIAGQGGAVYGLATQIIIRCSCLLQGNMAMQGGAVYIRYKLIVFIVLLAYN